MDNPGLLLWTIIALAVAFDFINGFHDTANAIATVVATRVLTPLMAILMAASLNFLGAISGTEVAKTIGSGIVGTNVPQELVISALIGAIIWNLITWYLGIPSSSSHALIGGLVGASLAAAGIDQVKWMVLFQKVIIPLVTSPLIGFFSGLILMKSVLRIFANFAPSAVGGFFRKAQVASSAFMAFSHGSNDAQKTMGIITLALISAGYIPAEPFNIPIWVIVLSAAAMALGTAGGGWRIIHTMGERLVKLTPAHGFSAETAAATIIELASRLGIPLSTTHMISSTIMGVGANKSLKNTRWGIAETIIQAWVLTIPVCAGLAWVSFMILVRIIH